MDTVSQSIISHALIPSFYFKSPLSYSKPPLPISHNLHEYSRKPDPKVEHYAIYAHYFGTYIENTLLYDQSNSIEYRVGCGLDIFGAL